LDGVKPKRLIAGACALALMAALGSCLITKPMVFDEAIPPEETASLFFVDLQPTSYNGIPLKKRSNPLIKQITNQYIPQGEAVFVVDIESVRTKGKDFVFSFNFEGGKEYYVEYEQSGDEYGVYIYNSHPLFFFENPFPANAKDTFIAFVPFTNQPDTVTTTYR
jgi:hypothetical protein